MLTKVVIFQNGNIKQRRIIAHLYTLYTKTTSCQEKDIKQWHISENKNKIISKLQTLKQFLYFKMYYIVN